MAAHPGKYAALALGLILSGPAGLRGMEWPDPTARLIENFGAPGDYGPTLGHSFQSGGVLRAAQAGEVIFQRHADDGASLLPSPLGSWMAVDHGEGIVGTYARYDAVETSAPRRIVEKGSVLGSAGSSGWAAEQGFYFSLYDRRERRWVNPSMLIPPAADTRPPTIRAVVLAGRDGAMVNPSQVRSLRQGTYRLLVDAFDTVDAAGKPLAPYRILGFVNGIEQGALHLETIGGRDGRLFVHRTKPTPAKQVYAAPYYDVGETRLSRGRAGMEIIVRDMAGNERIVSYQLNVE